MFDDMSVLRVGRGSAVVAGDVEERTSLCAHDMPMIDAQTHGNGEVSAEVIVCPHRAHIYTVRANKSGGAIASESMVRRVNV